MTYNDDNNERLDDAERAERLKLALDQLLRGEPTDSVDPLLLVARDLRKLPYDPSPLARTRFEQQVNRWFESESKRSVRPAPLAWRRPLVALVSIAAVVVLVAGLGSSYFANLALTVQPTPTAAVQPFTLTMMASTTPTATFTITISASPTSTNTPTLTPSATPSKTRVPPTRPRTVTPIPSVTNPSDSSQRNPAPNPVAPTSDSVVQPTEPAANTYLIAHLAEPTEGPATALDH